MKKIFFVLWLILLFLASSIYFAPANLLNILISKYTADTFNIVSSKGYLWEGEGILISKTRQVNNSILSQKVAPIKWKLQLNEIYKGKISLLLHTSSKPSVISWQGFWDFNINNLPVPIALVNNFIPKDMQATWRDLNAGGNIKIEYLNGTLDNQAHYPKIKSKINWMNGSLSIFPIQPLGDYSINFDVENQKASLAIKTLKGPLSINGSGTGEINKINMVIDFEASEKIKPILDPILRFWAHSVDNGKKYRLTLRNYSN